MDPKEDTAASPGLNGLATSPGSHMIHQLHLLRSKLTLTLGFGFFFQQFWYYTASFTTLLGGIIQLIT